jgi:hypothetical protein
LKSQEELLASFIKYCIISERDVEMYGDLFCSLSTQTSWMDYRRGYYDGVDDARNYYFERDLDSLK